MQGLGRTLVADTAAVEHVDPVGESKGKVEIVLDHQDWNLAPKLIDDVEYLLAHGRREPFERLVHEQKPRTANERAGDRHHLLLATR